MTYVSIHSAGTTYYPQIQLEWAPTTQPTVGTQTYVDITTRLREWAWSYGRNDELGAFAPGSGYVVLDNRDRAFDPAYTAGTWYGNIKPRRAFRLQSKIGSTESVVFIAYSRGYPQTWPSAGADSVVRVELVDQMAFLATFDLPVGFTRPEEFSGERVLAILEEIGVPDLRFIDTGTVTMAELEVTDTGVSALANIQECVTAEFGQFYDLYGSVVFEDRNHRIQGGTAWSPTYVFRDDPLAPNGCYDTTFEPRYDDTYLWNDVRVEGSNSVVGTAAGTTSQADYFSISKSISADLAFEPDATALAQYHVQRYQQPTLRVPALSFSMGGQRSDVIRGVFAGGAGVKVSDPVNITRFSATPGSSVQFKQYVEGVSHACRPGGPWTVSISASPADTNPYWTLETSTLGTIDSTNLISP